MKIIANMARIRRDCMYARVRIKHWNLTRAEALTLAREINRTELTILLSYVEMCAGNMNMLGIPVRVRR